MLLAGRTPSPSAFSTRRSVPKRLRSTEPGVRITLQHAVLEILLKRGGFGASGLILVDEANVHDLRSRNRNVIFQSFEDQTHPAPNVTGFEAVRTAP